MSDATDLEEAYRCAELSPDPSTQNGAVLRGEFGRLIMGTAACNDFPQGVHPYTGRFDRPLKYSYIEHAERNAIYNAARLGIKTKGLEMVAAWAACADCARAIVQAGIVRLIRHNPANSDEGAERRLSSIELGDTILREGGVEIVDFTERLPEARTVLRDGRPWRP